MPIVNGIEIKLGFNVPDTARFSGVPRFSDKVAVLPRSQWREHDDFADKCPPIEAQQNNNCTNAAWGILCDTAMAASGSPIPRRSWSHLYCQENGGVDAGAMCRDIVARALVSGNASREKWPDNKIFHSGPFPQDVVDDAAQCMPLEAYQCETFDDVGTALTLGFHIYQGFVLGKAFIERTGPDGVTPPWDGKYINGHATYGRGLRNIGGKWRVINPGTWGTGMAAAGVYYIDESYYWLQRGNYLNLDCYAVRAMKGLPAK